MKKGKTLIDAIKPRLRAFIIWQKLGFLPWKKPREVRSKRSGDFYKGAFDAIPFLNEDAKRTFSHLLLRPGYMIRDYIRGQHERYLAPLTALIIFYAFFALVSSVLEPVQKKESDRLHRFEEVLSENQAQIDSLTDNSSWARLTQVAMNTSRMLFTGYVYLNLDTHPEMVKTQHQSSLAALEKTLRSQGIPLFAGQFILLWLAMAFVLRKYRQGMSAAAAASAYVLCQFSFFMLFAVLVSLGKSSSIGWSLMLVLLTVDLHQWLGVGWKRSLRLAIRTGICYILILGLILLLVSGIALLVAWFSTSA